MSLTHLTAGFPLNDGLRLLERTSSTAGMKLINLARFGTSRVTYFSKLEHMRAFFAVGVVAPGDIILFTDAYDVAILDHWSTIVSRFLDLGAGIVFNGERHLWPTLESLPSISDTDRADVEAHFGALYTGPYPHMNSGCYIGYAHAIRTLIEQTLTVGHEYDVNDDQALAQYVAYHQPENDRAPIAVDHNDTIFATMSHSIEEYSFDGFTVRNHLTGTRPAILHSNGPKHTVRVFDVISRIRSGCGPSVVLSSVLINGRFLSHRAGTERLHLADTPEHALTLAFDRSYRRVLFTATGRIISLRPDATVDNQAKLYRDWENVLLTDDGAYTNVQGDLRLEDFTDDADGTIETTPIAFSTILYWPEEFVSRLLNWSWFW